MLATAFLAGCTQERDVRNAVPWGVVDDANHDSEPCFDLSDIQSNGEMIMLTLSGPDTYYDYRGKSLGAQSLLCQRFASHIGVALRIVACRDTTELLRMLMAGDGDVAAVAMASSALEAVADSAALHLMAGVGSDYGASGWVVGPGKGALAKAIEQWYEPRLLADARREDARAHGAAGVTRRARAPMKDSRKGVISAYDALFAKYSRQIRWDWRLMAAQCYQESAFDPQAKSWAGACGLMQIMPQTAERLGLNWDKVHSPESNIAAAATYLSQLESRFSDVKNRSERINFVLASYNGGYHHIRDAMRLAAKRGKDQYSWTDVSQCVLMLATPQGYGDPVVEHGYMRGGETVDYVSKIRQRWKQYQGAGTTRPATGVTSPRKAKRHNSKYDIGD